jgi:hypothetical protein
MNNKGEVRSASEFKSIFEDFGESYRPYRCPFCEVPYEDRCIITECVKAPHFKLPDGTNHRGECNGESGEDVSVGTSVKPAPAKRRVVGKIEIPEALVMRRKASIVRRPGDDGLGAPPDAVEIARRRKLIAADKTISSCFTTSQLRPIIHAYRRLRKHAFDITVNAGLEKGTPEYNASFRETLNEYDLSLYGQKLNYGNAFQGSKLRPYRLERVYYGSGTIRPEGEFLIIKDLDSWPKQAKDKKDLASFEVKLNRTPEAGAPTNHLKALEELEQLAMSNTDIEWHAYGLPLLQDDNYELCVESLDNFYWIVRNKR